MTTAMRLAAPVAVVVIMSAATLFAQATATVSGTVRDQSGGVLPGATVTATQTETGLTRTTVSNETGSFVLANLPLGPYQVEASLDGFRPFRQTGIVLQVNSSPVVNAVLAVGDLAEQIQVTAAAPLVDTRSSGVGTVVESQRIVELPLNARDVTQLVSLSGLAVQAGSSPGRSLKTGVLISVAGGNPFGVSYSLDGAPHVNNFDGTGLNLPFPDALQEFQLTTGSEEASGRSVRAAASVSAVTKSGTNALHGNLFEFARDSRFNEPDFFSGRKDGLKRNQFGGTLGGPLARDKAFFFVGFQMTTTRQNPLDLQSFVPTSAMLNGDFTTFASPQCNNGRQLALRAPFVNDRIAPGLMSPAALNIARLLPTPVDACGTVFWGVPVHENEVQVPVRLDVQLNPQHSLVGRYMLTTDDRRTPGGDRLVDNGNLVPGSNLLNTTTPGSDDRAHNVMLGHTWVISNTMVNSLRVLGNDVLARKPGQQFFSPEDVGINAYTSVPGYIRLIVAQAFNVGSGSFPSNGYTKIQNAGVSNDLTVVKGRHQLTFGGHYLWTKTDAIAQAFSVGGYTFTGQFTGNALADFMIGRIGQHRQASPNPDRLTQPMIGAYLQDSWKLDRVTLNYGLVWNPFLPLNFYDADGYTFSREKFVQGVTSRVMKNAPPGFSYAGDPGFDGTSGVRPHYNEWDPRVGVAWDVRGDGRTAVRASAGISHDYINQYVHINTSSAAPFRLTVTLPPGVSLDDPWAGYPGGNAFPYTFDPDNPQFPAYASYLPLPEELTPTTQTSWSTAFQHQVTPRWFASATYVGNRIRHQLVAEEQNPALSLGFGPCSLYDATIGAERFYPVCTVPGNREQRRALNLMNPTAALGYMTQYTDKGYQDYNGMLLNTRLDLASAWNLNANYTLSKCAASSPLGTVLNVGANYIHQPYQNNGPQDISLDEGPCNTDVRHLFNLTSVFRTPQIGRGLLGILASDWTLASVLQVRSGLPVNVVVGGDPALNGFTDNAPTQRPDVVAGADPYGNTGGTTGYFNIAAFGRPAAGALGNASYNLLRGPGFWQWDQSFVRAFTLGSGRRLELRAEAINLTNRFNRGNPAADINNPATFGRITSLATGATARLWQFAVKYAF